MKELKKQIKLMLLGELIVMLENQLEAKRLERLLIQEHIQTLRYVFHDLKSGKIDEHEI